MRRLLAAAARPRQRPATEARGSLDDRGAVTAEFAVVLPAVIVVLALAVGVLCAAATTVRAQHLATEAARLAGRGDDSGVAAIAAAGGRATVRREQGLVCVEATMPVPMRLPVPPLSARACALDGGR